MPELTIDVGRPRSRSIDLAVTRLTRGEAAVIEIWDWLDDVGAAWRGFDAKKQALAGRLGLDGSVVIGGLFVMRATRRNRMLVRQFGALFAARFSAASKAWLRALTDPRAPMPREDGFLWSLADGRLVAARLGSA
jgi:hypothetical protein